MIAAVYARKSTEQNVAEDAKSVTRQIALARAFAEGRGWTVADEHVYSDDGISGAEFDDRRPGLARLLASLKQRPRPFDVLVMMDESRLGRDQWRTGYVLAQLKDAGLAIWYYQANRQANLADATGQFMENVYGFAAQMEREKAVARGREDGRSRASKGYVAGGAVFGYRNVSVNSHVERQIVEPQAEVIRRIFREIAEGRGYAKVAQRLNADRVPCPTGKRWAMTCVREMVYRELYRGRIVYGKTRWDYTGGKHKVRVPEAEWVTVEAPALRIVPEELWRAAHERVARTRQAYLRATGGKLYGRPESGVESKYLLSGFLTCGACGGGMHVIRRSSQRGRRMLYFCCTNWRVNGACRNSMSVHTGDLDAALLGTLKTDVLTPEIVEAVVTRTIELARLEPDEHAERQRRLTSEAQRLQEEIARLTEAIATGGSLAPLVEALKDRERQRADALARLEHLDGLSRAPEWGNGIRDTLRVRLNEWNGFLGRQPEIARQILRKLLLGRLVLQPDETARAYTVQGRASYGRLLDGIIRVKGMVPPG
jgi:site-specific DNA recombinase